jgi:hypothetical protein
VRHALEINLISLKYFFLLQVNVTRMSSRAVMDAVSLPVWCVTGTIHAGIILTVPVSLPLESLLALPPDPLSLSSV